MSYDLSTSVIILSCLLIGVLGRADDTIVKNTEDNRAAKIKFNRDEIKTYEGQLRSIAEDMSHTQEDAVKERINRKRDSDLALAQIHNQIQDATNKVANLKAQKDSSSPEDRDLETKIDNAQNVLQHLKTIEAETKADQAALTKNLELDIRKSFAGLQMEQADKKKKLEAAKSELNQLEQQAPPKKEKSNAVSK